MQKTINGNTIYFYDNNNNEIMYLDHSTDECIWYFNSNNIINITQDMELYNILDNFMKQEYIFINDELKNYKDNNKLIWYSDCYYNPDNEWSISSVSCLNIERKENCFNIWCTKELDKKIERPHKFHCICFSPGDNGKYSKNINTNLTLQDDFITYIYQRLLDKSKNKVLKNK